MNERDIELAKQAGWQYAHGDSGFEPLWKFADLIRADEREKVIGFIREYPYWLGDTAKKELISAIRARGNT
jgi:hypothetical protein